MTKLERLQALEREATKGPWHTGHVHDSYCIYQAGEEGKGALAWTSTQRFRDGVDNGKLIAALRNAAPDLIQVALAAQWYIECLEAVLERRPVRGLDEAQHGYEAAIAPLLESEEPSA